MPIQRWVTDELWKSNIPLNHRTLIALYTSYPPCRTYYSPLLMKWVLTDFALAMCKQVIALKKKERKKRNVFGLDNYAFLIVLVILCNSCTIRQPPLKLVLHYRRINKFLPKWSPKSIQLGWMAFSKWRKTKYFSHSSIHWAPICRIKYRIYPFSSRAASSQTKGVDNTDSTQTMHTNLN